MSQSKRLLDNRYKTLHEHLKDLVRDHGFSRLDVVTGYLYERGWASVDYLGPGKNIRTVSSNIVDAKTNQLLKNVDVLTSGQNTQNEVRIFDQSGMTQHGKLFILSGSSNGSDDIAIIGSSNLTGPGLGTSKHKNLELNWVITEQEGVDEVKDFFESLWKEAKHPSEVSFDVQSSFRRSPEKVKFVQLVPGILTYAELIEQYLTDDQQSLEEYSLIKDHPYQLDAVEQIDFRLQTFGTCLLADDVGLGKTIMGTATLKKALSRELVCENPEDNQQSLLAVIVCPKAVEGQWLTHISKCCHEIENELESKASKNLIQRVQLLTYGSEARKDIDDIAESLKSSVKLIIVDEAHRLRNGTRFYDFLGKVSRSIKSSGSSPRYLLLTATPINNSFLDLYNIFKLTLPPNYWSEREITDIRSFLTKVDQGFSGRQSNEQEKNLEKLRLALGDLMIRRDSSFLQKEYGKNILKNLKIPTVQQADSPLRLGSHALHGIEQDLAKQLKSIKFLPYQLAIGYDERNEENKKEIYSGVKGVMRSHLAKSMQSSFTSASHSLSNVINTCEQIMRTGDRSLISRINRDMGAEESEIKEKLSGSDEQDKINSYQIDSHSNSASKDLQRMKGLLEIVDKNKEIVDKEKADFLISKISASDRTLIFTEYRSTAAWLIKYMQNTSSLRVFPGVPDKLESDKSLQAELNRLDPSCDSQSSSEDPNYDIYVLTDKYSEGRNLHKCNRMIHYDLPWNPIRKTQRQGRIVRIGSPHDRVFVDSIAYTKNELHDFADPEKVLRTKLKKISTIVGQGDNRDLNQDGAKFRSYFVSMNRASLGDLSDDRAQSIGTSNAGNHSRHALNLWNEIKDNYVNETKGMLNKWRNITAQSIKTIVLHDVSEPIVANILSTDFGTSIRWFKKDSNNQWVSFDFGDPAFKHLTCSSYTERDRLDDSSLVQLKASNRDASRIVREIMQEIYVVRRYVQQERRIQLRDELNRNSKYRPIEDLKELKQELSQKMVHLNEIDVYIQLKIEEIKSWANVDSTWVAICTDGYLNAKKDEEDEELPVAS